MSQMTAGQAVIESLQAEGVEYVFGIIGVSFLDIADAFSERDLSFFEELAEALSEVFRRM